MVNDNKNDFMSVVNTAAEEYKKRSYESCMEGFMSSMIKDAVSIDVPSNVELGVDEKEAILNEVTKTIKTSANEFIKNAVEDETGTLHNVNVAHEIVNPKNLSESIMQLVSAHVYDEANDRVKMLEADFDSGKINNMSFEDASKYIDTIFEPLFITQLDNGKNLKKGLENLMSSEGAELVDDIKNTVSKLVLETEAKNSVIREAVSDINETKAKIEKKINGETDEEKEEKAANGDNNDTSSSDTDDSDLNDEELGDSEQATEGLFIRALKRSKKRNNALSCEDLFTVRNIGGTFIQSGEDWSKNYDSTSFSREAAEDILDEFRELDDGIDPKTVNDDEAFSVSNDDGESCIDNQGSSTAESAENTYVDDNGEEIEEFQSSYNGEITPDPIPSLENMVQQILPMNLQKIGTHKFEPNAKLKAYLALQQDNGKLFFNTMRTRVSHALEMLDKTEGDVIDGLAKSDVEKQLTNTVDEIDSTEKGVSKLLEDMGIAGILDNKFQRSANPIDNAMKSLFNPEIIKPMDVSLSKEELHEHELADIFKLALKISDVKSEIADRSDVIGNKQQLGYLEELLNEKVVNLEPGEKFEVENKIDALQSIESQISLSDLMDMEVFLSKSEGTDNKEKISLNSLRDIDAYGYSFFEESEKIKASVKANWNEKLKNSGVKYNIDTDKLVEFVLDEQDTTKIDSNIFEKVMSKLASDKIIENSAEALILRNKAKAISTAYITADKLGFLSKEDIANIRKFVM